MNSSFSLKVILQIVWVHNPTHEDLDNIDDKEDYDVVGANYANIAFWYRGDDPSFVTKDYDEDIREYNWNYQWNTWAAVEERVLGLTAVEYQHLNT